MAVAVDKEVLARLPRRLRRRQCHYRRFRRRRRCVCSFCFSSQNDIKLKKAWLRLSFDHSTAHEKLQGKEMATEEKNVFAQLGCRDKFGHWPS